MRKAGWGPLVGRPTESWAPTVLRAMVMSQWCFGEGPLGPQSSSAGTWGAGLWGRSNPGSAAGLTSRRDLDVRPVMEPRVLGGRAQQGGGTEARNKARTPRRPQLGDGEAARGPWHRAPRGATASRFWFIRAQWAAGVAETPFQRSAACPRPRGPALKPVSSPSLTTRRTARGQRTGRAKRQTQHLAKAAGPTAAPPQPRLVPGTARLRPYRGALGEGPR